jgi:hypothetical protein
VSYQLTPRAWAALSAAYGSGLPFEDVEEDASEAAEHASERVLERVDFDAGRVKPGLSFDASAGVVIARSGSRSARLQAEVRNLMNRLNVINFSGLFSGTALAPPRSFAVRLSVDF